MINGKGEARAARTRRPQPALVLSIIALGCAGLVAGLAGFRTAPADGRGNATTANIVIVTAGQPSELAFKLSKTSLLPWAAKTRSMTVTFKVTNKGKLSHDFKVCKTPAKTDKANSCNGTSTKLLKPGQSTTLTITFKQRGIYKFLCTVPGHAAGGMKGLIGIGVKPTAPSTTSTATTTTTTTAATTTTIVKPPATEALGGDPVAGAAVWAANGCGSCHTLKAAGATGGVGPNLDQVAPGQAAIIVQVQGGSQYMPAFGSLTSTQLANLAAYVYQSTHA